MRDWYHFNIPSVRDGAAAFHYRVPGPGKFCLPADREVCLPVSQSPGARLRAALELEKPLQVVGVINAYAALLAERAGFRAIYLSGGGVAAG